MSDAAHVRVTHGGRASVDAHRDARDQLARELRRSDRYFQADLDVRFYREDNGAVTIRCGGVTRRLSPGTWASVVAFVSDEGETGERFHQALAFHGGNDDYGRTRKAPNESTAHARKNPSSTTKEEPCASAS